MKALLTELGELLARKDPRARSTLRPGASAAAFAPLTARLPVPLHSDLVTLWEWHDGADHGEPSPFEIASSCAFMSVDTATRTWDQQQAMREAESPRAMVAALVARVRDDLPVDHMTRYDQRYPFS